MNTAPTRREETLARYERATELPMAFLALAIIPLLVITFAVDLTAAEEAAVWTIDWTIWAIFAVDLGIRTYLAEHRITYLVRHWYDVLIVVLPLRALLARGEEARAFRDVARWLRSADAATLIGGKQSSAASAGAGT